MGCSHTIWLWGERASSERDAVSACHVHTASPWALRRVMPCRCMKPGRSAGSSLRLVRGLGVSGRVKRTVWRSRPMMPVAVSLRSSAYSPFWPR